MTRTLSCLLALVATLAAPSVATADDGASLKAGPHMLGDSAVWPRAAKKNQTTVKPEDFRDLEDFEFDDGGVFDPNAVDPLGPVDVDPLDDFDYIDPLGPVEVEPLEDFGSGRDRGRAPVAVDPLDPLDDFDDIDLLDLEPVEDPRLAPLGDLEADLEMEEMRRSPARQATRGGDSVISTAPGLGLGVQLDVVGRRPLEDNYAPRIVAVERDAVVVELPLLLGRSRVDFDGNDYWVVAEVMADGAKVAEARQWVTRASLAEFGPSFMFIKLLAPVGARDGTLEIRVSRASSASGRPTLLFSRDLAYALP